MFSLSRILVTTLAAFALSKLTHAGIHGHSGIVFHMDKYGHYSGHSTHYDYRVFPEKSLLAPLPLIDHHNVIGHSHHLDDDDHHHLSEAFHLIDEDYHSSRPYFYYIHHHDHHDHHLHNLNHH